MEALETYQPREMIWSGLVHAEAQRVTRGHVVDITIEREFSHGYELTIDYGQRMIMVNVFNDLYAIDIVSDRGDFLQCVTSRKWTSREAFREWLMMARLIARTYN